MYNYLCIIRQIGKCTDNTFFHGKGLKSNQSHWVCSLLRMWHNGHNYQTHTHTHTHTLKSVLNSETAKVWPRSWYGTATECQQRGQVHHSSKLALVSIKAYLFVLSSRLKLLSSLYGMNIKVLLIVSNMAKYFFWEWIGTKWIYGKYWMFLTTKWCVLPVAIQCSTRKSQNWLWTSEPVIIGTGIYEICPWMLFKGLFGYMLLLHLSEVDKQSILDNKW